MKNFEYFAPQSLVEAVNLLDKYGDQSKVLAGGTDLVVQMKNGRANPAVIIDVKKVPELNRLEWKPNKATLSWRRRALEPDHHLSSGAAKLQSAV